MKTEARAKVIVAELMSMAYTQAETVLIKHADRHKQLVPTFAILTGDNLEVVACPWNDDSQKYMAQGLIKARMKQKGSTAYSFLCEAWMVKLHRDEYDETRRAGEDFLQPSQSDRRVEIVSIVACCKHEAGIAKDFKIWDIIRNDKGEIIKLDSQDKPGDKALEIGGEFPSLLDD
jgi:hypothetical protein